MRSVPLDPPVADQAPATPGLSPYDEKHLITYLRLLDAEAAGADWKDVARAVLHLDPGTDEARAKLAWKSHLDRAHWLVKNGFRHLLDSPGAG